MRKHMQQTTTTYTFMVVGRMLIEALIGRSLPSAHSQIHIT